MRSLFLWLCRADGAAAPAPAAPRRVWKDTDPLSDVIDAAVARNPTTREARAVGWKARLSEEELVTVRDWTCLSADLRNAKFTAGLIGTLNAELNPPAVAAPASGSCTC